MSQINNPGPSMVWSTIDEHWDGINDAVFYFDPGAGAGQQYWRDLPASYHGPLSEMSFMDGHAEAHKWISQGVRNPSSWPVKVTSYPSGNAPWNGSMGGPTFTSDDYAWMNDRMPFQ
jgi:hypothetical protein